MDFELNQTAVYWARGDPDGEGGYSWSAPLEIDCRWEAVTELFMDASGEQRYSKAKVFLSQDVVVGGFLFLGTIDDLDSSGSPFEEGTDIFEIRRFDKIPDLAGSEYLKRVFL